MSATESDLRWGAGSTWNYCTGQERHGEEFKKQERRREEAWVVRV